MAGNPYGGGGAQLEDNCVLYSKVQNLTDGQQAQARENIGVVGTGEDGVGWYPASNLSGYFLMDLDLADKVNVGDYLVQKNNFTSGGGTTSLGLGAVYKVTHLDGEVNGQYKVTATPMNFTIRGEKGEDADPNSVLYTAQTLTDEQKQQARENIGAITADEAQVPVASQTQFGTVKVYTDSEGYLCIDTE